MRLRRFCVPLVFAVLAGGGVVRADDAGEPDECVIGEAEWCEVRAVAASVGVDYVETVRGAAKGDVRCLRRLMRFTTTGAVNEENAMSGIASGIHGVVLAKLLARVGDGKFAAALSAETVTMRAAVLKDLSWREDYLVRWYPRTAAAFGVGGKVVGGKLRK